MNNDFWKYNCPYCKYDDVIIINNLKYCICSFYNMFSMEYHSTNIYALNQYNSISFIIPTIFTGDPDERCKYIKPHVRLFKL